MPKQIVVVRAKPHDINREYQFLEGTASIGWPTDKSLKQFGWEELKEVICAKWKNSTNSTITQIYKFVNIPVDSYIMTPSYETRDIHIFKTISEYKFREDWIDENNPHTIDVNLIKTVSRNIFPEQIQRSLLAARRTVTNFSKYYDILSPIFEDKEVFVDSQPGDALKNEEIEESRQTLRELLKSSNEEIRLKAALALLENR